MDFWSFAALDRYKLPLIFYILSSVTNPIYCGLKVVVKNSNNVNLKGILQNESHGNSVDEETSELEYIYQTTCEYNGLHYPAGEFHLSECITCTCNETTAQVTCRSLECPVIKNCISYQDTSSSSTEQCCPKCVEYGCVYNRTLYKAGEKIRKSDCTKCYCPWEAREEGGGEPKCLTIQCNAPRCVDGVVPQGKCCPVCPNGPNCYLDNQIISEGERIYVDKCRYCYCEKETGNGLSPTKPRQAKCERSFFCI